MIISPGSIAAAEAIIRAHNGIIRSSQAIREGIHPRTLYHLRDNGYLEVLARGVYRIAGRVDTDLATVAAVAPSGVVCLISALAHHGITTEIPHEVHIALSRTQRPPHMAWPPVRFFRFSGGALTEGVSIHTINGVGVRIYDAAKTVADCFKFRNKIGLDVAVEGLKLCLERHRTSHAEIFRYARICRVQKIITPYLEAYP